MHKHVMIMDDNYIFQELYLNEEIANVIKTHSFYFELTDRQKENIRQVDEYFSALKRMLSGVTVKRTIKGEALLQQTNKIMYDSAGYGSLYDSDLIELQMDISTINMELNLLLFDEVKSYDFFTYVEKRTDNLKEMSSTITNTIMTVTDAKYYEEQ